MELVRVAASPQALLNGVAVSPRGRVFSSFPRWTAAPTPSVAEAMPDGRFRAYPGAGWNDWRPGLPPQEAIVSAHSVYADATNVLWVVDDAAPRSSPPVDGAAKLIRIDLATDRVTRVYRFDQALLPPGAMLGHLRVDTHHAYVTEAHHGSIIVVDLESGRARKVLSQHPATRADASIAPVVQGREFRRRDGRVPLLHVDILELSGDAKWLYFMPLFGPVLRRVETKYLRDPAASDEEIGMRIEDVARVPPCAGIAKDAAGNFYLSSFTQDAILRMGPDRTLETLVSDPRISFPNESAVGADGCLYVPCSQIHRLPAFGDGTSVVRLPFEVLRIALTPP